MDTLVHDLRYAARMLLRNPGFTALAIAALALGLGANTAIFSVVNSILLKPLPYADPDRLVVTLHNGSLPVSPADFLDYRRDLTAFTQMSAAQGWGAALRTAEGSESIPGLRISSNMLDLLGVVPLLGRSFTAEEEQPGRSNLLLLSYALWQRRFGGDRAIVGRTLTLDGAPFSVIGVMPPQFRFAPFWLTRAEMWAPLDLSARLNDRGGRSLRVFARLKPGVSLAQAQSQMDAVARRLGSDFPRTNAKLGISVVPLREKVVGAVRPTLLVLLGTVSFVLLIACANVANLLLTRAIARRKEMALRLAVGAGRARLLRQLLTESCLLAALGGIAGLLLARWGVTLLIRILPPASLPRQQELGLDLSAFLFALAVTFLTGLLSGLAPAVQLSRSDLNDDLKEANRGATGGASRRRTTSLLIAAEVALALVLLSAAGLMIRTMRQLQSIQAGFDPRQLLTLTVSLGGTASDAPGRRSPAFDRVQQALASIPQIESVGAINHLPLAGDAWTLGYKIEGRPEPAPGEELSALYRVVTPAYFRAMRIRIVAGREFTAFDRQGSPAVAIINESMVRRRWPGESPLGKRVLYGSVPGAASSLHTIVGVIADARQTDWTSPATDEIYLSYLQRPDVFGLSSMTFVLRTQTRPENLGQAVRRAMASVDPGLSVSDLAGMEHIIADKLWRSRLSTLLFGLFAGIALLLAAVGIYGVIAYSVRRRTREIGIRMALGATRGEVVRRALVDGMRPVFLGAAVGLAGALEGTRLMRGFLYGVTANDPLTFGAVTITLLAVAALATYIPSRRAAGVEPLLALRHE